MEQGEEEELAGAQKSEKDRRVWVILAKGVPHLVPRKNFSVHISPRP